MYSPSTGKQRPPIVFSLRQRLLHGLAGGEVPLHVQPHVAVVVVGVEKTHPLFGRVLHAAVQHGGTPLEVQESQPVVQLAVTGEPGGRTAGVVVLQAAGLDVASGIRQLLIRKWKGI